MTLQKLPQLDANFFVEGLRDNPSQIAPRIEQQLVAHAGDHAVVASNGLDLRRYASLGFAKISAADSPRPDSYRYWHGEGSEQLGVHFDQVVWHVSWRDSQLLVVHVEWNTSCGGSERDWVIADSVAIAEEFMLDIERKTHAPGNAILVFADGEWERSEELYAATQSASFDDLLLADDLKRTIRDDFSRFLDSEDRYQRLGIAWKRGALLIGPPGNGKTHCVRALVRHLAISSLYVQSLSHHYYTPEQMWKRVFSRARGLTPCVLVLEDLDSLVTPENRSFFLNQLDGFQQNHGLIVLATTNYPERIDTAIIDRPSRFDRKYHFDLPIDKLRRQYLQHWQQKLAGETGWSDASFDSLVRATHDFSFAYLKELVISSVVAWMQQSKTSLDAVMAAQVAILKRQMRSEAQLPPANGDPVLHSSTTVHYPSWIGRGLRRLRRS